MPKHLYLPEIDGNIGEPPVAGVWHGYERRLLRGVSDGIVVGQGAVDRGVSSVPDAWARPLMFQNALAPGSDHPMRARAVQEWRGLLSLLALHKLQQYDVDVVPLALGAGAAASGSGAGTPAADATREFVRALLRLLPAPVALERGRPYEWSDTLLVRYDGIPVGAFSPATLVYTAADYNRRLAATTLNLKDAAGYLAPPAPDQREELRYVAAWAEQLQERLNAPGNPGAAILDTAATDPTARAAVRLINALLDEWLAELRAALGVRRGERVEAPDVEVDPEMAEVRPAATAPGQPFLDRYRVYQAVLHPLRRSAAARGAATSDLRLDATRNASGYEQVVVITPGLLRTNDRIWQSRRLVHLGGDAARAIAEHFDAPAGWGQQVEREDLRPANAIWIRPERYFLTDTLSATEDGSPMLAAEWQAMNGEAQLLLPFNRRILDFFSPADIRERLRPEYRRVENGVTFSFSLPVNGRTERVQRTYRQRHPGPGEGRVETFTPPAVQLFPRYVDANWRRYYLFQGGAERVTVDPVLAPVPNGAARPAVAERVHAPAESNGAGGGAVRGVEIAGAGAYPEALVFAANGGAAPGTPLGLALVPRPAEPPGLAGAWRVGIDFGTSNTNVFRQSTATDLAERWRFEFDQYVVDVTARRPAAGAPAGAVSRAFFVPAEPVELPVPTALRVFQDARTTHMLLDYGIFFSSSYELPRDVHADLKWDSEEERNMKPFLRCLLFLVLVEVGLRRVGRVTLACSYPKAFSLSLQKRYEGAWGSVARELLDDPATAAFLRRRGAGTDGPEVGDPEFETEGVAAGEFFASDRTIPALADRATKQIAAVCLDVGGGTTDVSIWHRNEIVLDASVLLAGREIAGLLQQSPRAIEVLFSAEAARALDAVRTEPAAFAARLNVVLRREEGAVRERLLDHANHPEVLWLRRMLAVEFGAIAFYSASLLGAVNHRLGGALARTIESRAIRLHWGGNAAKLLNWIDFGRYDETGIASRLLNALLFNALKFDPQDGPIAVPAALLAQKQSPGHKSEAAGGLVVMRAAGQGGRGAAGPAGDDGGYEIPGDAGAGLGALGGGADADFEMPADGGAAAASGGLSPDVVAGENIQLTTGPVRHVQTVSGATLFGRAGTHFQGTSLERLGKFVEVLNYFGVRFGLFTDEAKVRLDGARRRTIADAVLTRFVDAERLPEGQRVIEPVFVTEVRLLLKDLLDERRRGERR